MQSYLLYMQGWWSELMDNFCISAALSTLTTMFLQYTGSNVETVVIWLAFSTVDCILGMTIGILTKKFSVRKLYKWVWKIFVQLTIILMFAAMLRAVTLTANIELMLTNWIVCLFAFFDFTTAIDKLLILKVPVPKFMLAVLALLRKRISRTVATAVGTEDEEDARRLEAALDPNKPKRRRRKKADDEPAA